MRVALLRQTQQTLWGFPKLHTPILRVPHLSTTSIMSLKVRPLPFHTIEKGRKNTSSYKVYVASSESACSPWHDVPLYFDISTDTYNMVVEIPRWTNAKMEMNTKGKLNYIKQDEKKGKLRYVGNIFPHHGYIWNYGAFPQTWEDPDSVDEWTQCKGDNDPLDVCEIGDKVHKIGEVVSVKILGAMAMIDEGETDWKMLVIDVKDPLADKINDVADIEKHKPGLLKATYEWFVHYKIPDGKPKNSFAFDGEAKDKEFAMKVLWKMHDHWKKLVMGHMDNLGNLTLDSTTIAKAVVAPTQEEANQEVEAAEPYNPDGDPLPDTLNDWHYVS